MSPTTPTGAATTNGSWPSISNVDSKTAIVLITGLAGLAAITALGLLFLRNSHKGPKQTPSIPKNNDPAPKAEIKPQAPKAKPEDHPALASARTKMVEVKNFLQAKHVTPQLLEEALKAGAEPRLAYDAIISGFKEAFPDRAENAEGQLGQFEDLHQQAVASLQNQFIDMLRELRGAEVKSMIANMQAELKTELFHAIDQELPDFTGPDGPTLKDADYNLLTEASDLPAYSPGPRALAWKKHYALHDIIGSASAQLKGITESSHSDVQQLAAALQRIWSALEDYQRDELSDRQIQELSKPLANLAIWMSAQDSLNFNDDRDLQTKRELTQAWNALNKQFQLDVPLEFSPPTLSEQWANMLSGLGTGVYALREEMYPIIADAIRKQAISERKSDWDVLTGLQGMEAQDKNRVVDLLLN